ncbi:HsdR family type I site-specific deoxyribonuclease [Mycobacteroides abscessus subsp. massiliense]|uniref:HsdR family type I site-specific deoxyribonuclease n=1 Tax=Mycobacteroides abscessus TaxID=36809 RepID=UPI0002ECFD22|nr:HsdR family type I site-specific deoxyribonuclease [Mycobacteroides abscessus]MBN7384530.1 HsdR family type I site-specific deoxyribonuclease [Mycobacteroides abscessus subsp. abscessus]MBN7415302.1 HsdR family type I site-specific deoxyribonuclease [Mycobacteroides abscessus subsp. abscessus]SKH36324.1 HsdR family type I site-specific deoxyribonuclease [Mycobacteroides abscessus subsp. bolletii]SKU98368.1 HsdR family type I site-specific deoxyribonuclease [Mycobacteroides abscessus subsp. b
MTGASNEAGLVEGPSLALLSQLGWTIVSGFQETFGPAGTLGRDSMHDAVLTHRLRDALRDLNPLIPDSIRDEALAAITRDRSMMDRVRANREIYNLVREGYRAEWTDDQGERQYATVAYIEFHDSTKNEWIAVPQMWFAGDLYRRRTDTVLFVNGIPLVLFEFKDPSRPVKAAYDENITDYRDAIPQLFVPNGFVVLSNGTEAKVGSTHAPWEFFSDWTVIDAHGNRGVIALDTAIRGTCTPHVLLDLIENFVAYIERPGGLIKTVARSHQYHGVNAAIDNLHQVRATEDKRLGVFWHTQGSGKSLSMLWFTQKVLRQLVGAWTFVMVTDRTELDVQLHGEFADAGVIPAEANVHASSIAHLRELLSADHRYVFTLIHKFQPAKDEKTMPVLSDRSDVIVITDEAHRSQYDTLALNMRRALPNASFMGFTGTPLIVGEELTKQQFGDYVSTYNFRAAIEDGATVPLYYENRIPELQLVNEDFEEELENLLESAELDEAAEGQLVRRFGKQYTLLTRPERLRKIAKDLVTHFVGRGFTGKAMYVGLDKAAAVRMHDYVREAWDGYLSEIRAQHDALPELERPWLASRIKLMETTDMAVVVSQGQNEIASLEGVGLDIRPHRARMNREDLAEKFKDANDPLRLVFVCAMWMTGFDAPSVSTIYLDRPMRNHTLMQTIARANRVFPDKDNGLIVDYVGVFRNLEKALAIYGAANAENEIGSPIEEIDALAGELAAAVDNLVAFCSDQGVDIRTLSDASGFEHIALRDAAVEAMLVDEDVRTIFMAGARQVRKLFKALLPDARAALQQQIVAAIRVVAERIADLSRPSGADITAVADAVDALLDRSVGAEEYVIRAAAQGSEPDPLIDLSQIDFDALAARFAGRKRAETDRLAELLKQRAASAATRNPTRYDLVQRIEDLIDQYNAGSINIDEYLRRLIDLSRTLTEEEARSAREGLSEEELAVFDLLTKPEPVLSEDERAVVKASAKKLLTHIHDKVVLDWRRKAATAADVKSTIRQVLDETLPADPYPLDLFNSKVQVVFDHFLSAYGDDGSTVYRGENVQPVPSITAVATLELPDLARMSDEVIELIRTNEAIAARVAEELHRHEPQLRTVEQLIENDEDFSVEFKSTARWDLRENQKNKAMEDAVVKTIAAFLNTDGGTLLIGVDNQGAVLGLDVDYECVKPANGDGFVNWLTTHLINAIGNNPTTLVRARIVVHQGKEICRVDVGRSADGVWAKTSKGNRVFFVRVNNSTRQWPDDDVAEYLLGRK